MESFEQAVEFACYQPKLVADRALKAGLCETDEYLSLQKLYNRIVYRNKLAAKAFAREILEKGGPKLACSKH